MLKYGGPVARMALEPVADINSILANGVTFGIPVKIKPLQYKHIIGLGQCYGNWPLWETQQERLSKGLRGFDAFIADSPLSGAFRYSSLATLKKLKDSEKSVPMLIIRGGKTLKAPLFSFRDS
jgi:hypothetical protein